MYKGIFIPGITIEEFRNASLESVEELMAEGTMCDIETEYSGWIPLLERYPDINVHRVSKPLLLSIVNFPEVLIGRYVEDENGEDGAFVAEGSTRTLAQCGLMVSAWMPLPKPYRED